MRSIYLLFLLFALVSGLTAQSLYDIPAHHFGEEPATGFRLARLDLDAVNADPTLTAGVVIEAVEYRFADPLAQLGYGAVYPVFVDGVSAGTLAFTRLPLINVTLPSELSRTEHGPGTFTYADDEATVVSTVGVRHRGGFSTTFPKRSLDLEFWEDAVSEESTDVTFGTLREDDDWIMDALYNEPLRVNSFVAHQLWLDLHDLHYAEEEPRAKAGAGVLLTEAFVDGVYTGVYMLSEQVDRKQLRLKRFNEDGIRGELYKGDDWSDATRFLGVVPLSDAGGETWAGWEMKLPDPDDTLDWTNLYELTDFVVNSSDDDFRSNAGDRLDLDNMIDYFLYVNALLMVDNLGKNIYLAKYEEESPYFYIPWDLDTSFGNDYQGGNLSVFRGWLRNGLLTRLFEVSPDYYSTRLCDRYSELRADLLHPDSLGRRMDLAMTYLSDNGVYARESTVFPESINVSDDQTSFTDRFLRERFEWLDDNVCALATSLLPERERSGFMIYPNPAIHRMTVSRTSSRPVDYTITSLVGQQLKAGTLSGVEQTVYLTGLPPGMYVITVAGRSLRFIIGR